MSFVSAKCPQCGGDLQLDSDKETAFCMHCGSKIIVQEAIRTVRVDNTHMIESWMKMGDSALEGGNHEEAYGYYTKVVEAQPNNWQAIFNKGKSAGWQSTLANLRLYEAFTNFGEAIILAPENQKDKIKEQTVEEAVKLALACISLRSERFIKWPDEEEALGLLNDYKNILAAAKQLFTKAEFKVTGFMAPVAELITSTVMTAYRSKINPDYLGNENRPNEYEWQQYIERIGYCTSLLELAIGLSEDDDSRDITRYEYLIELHTDAISSCSWQYDRDGGIFGPLYVKGYELNSVAKAMRRADITEYKNKIARLKAKIRNKEEFERQQKAWIAEAEATKRFQDYWSTHAEEKNRLESEKITLLSQIDALNSEKEVLKQPFVNETYSLKKDISTLEEEQRKLNLFRAKEKKAIQERIDIAQNKLAAVESSLKQAQDPMIQKMNDIQRRINEIDNELTKAR